MSVGGVVGGVCVCGETRRKNKKLKKQVTGEETRKYRISVFS